MKKALLLCIVLFSFNQNLSGHSMSGDIAIQRLMKGNDRYTRDQLDHPNRTSERRDAVSRRQTPFAIIVGCSDSRVAPEILFDQGVGDLFVIRVAGNVVGDIALESIKFAAMNLGSSVIMVLGHENCGAVAAVLDNQASTIPVIAKHIAPAIKGDTSLEEAVKDNVKAVVSQLRRTSFISKLSRKGKITVVGGYYDLKTGDVQLVDK